jgi:hypothetical protein
LTFFVGLFDSTMYSRKSRFPGLVVEETMLALCKGVFRYSFDTIDEDGAEKERQEAVKAAAANN